MANIITHPASGIYFDGSAVGTSTIPTLTGNASGVAIQYDGYAGLKILSSATGVDYQDRFSIEGENGRLFGVSDQVTGSVFSVNDGAGLPLIDVRVTADYSKLTLGQYGTDALVISGSSVQVTGSNVVTQGYLSDQSYMTTADETYSTSAELLAALLGVDGASSNLDADKLDGQHGSYYLDYGNFSNTPTIPSAANNATITLSGGTDIDTIGDFTTNQSANETLTINHSNVTRSDTTSSLSPAFGGTFTVVDGVTSSARGHVTAQNVKTITLPSLTVTSSSVSDGVNTFNKATLASLGTDAFDNAGTYASLRAQGTTASDVGLGNVTNESKATMFTSPSFTGDVVITDDTFPFLKSVTNANGIGINFSDQTSNYAQIGTLKFVHQDTASYGSASAFILSTTEASSTILADGKLMYGEGIYSKPASGTGAGTRKDSNWDSAYTHVSATNNPHSVTATQVGLGNVTNESKATMFASPTFTGTPIAPTAATSTNTTQIATTAFVKAQSYLATSGGTMTGDLSLNDSATLKIGSDDDLQIYHSSPYNYIHGAIIRLRGNGTEIVNNDNDAYVARFLAGENSCSLYYDGTVRISTTSLGGSINGKLVISGDLEVGGSFSAVGDVTVPLMTNTVRGGAKIGYGESGDNYAVRIDANEKLYVTVDADDVSKANLLTRLAQYNSSETVYIGDADDDTTVVIRGNLQVDGTTTTVNSTTITVDDKNIELGSIASPTDSTADGGGITLKGATDKTLTWVDSTDSWTSNQKFSAPNLTLTSLSNQTSSTALVISSNEVGTRELGSNAFTSTTIPTNNNQLTNGAGYITAVRTVTAGGNTLGASETLAFTAGSNISISESAGAVTISSSHPSVTEATANLSNSGRTYIQSITLDTNGHVTAVSTGTETVTNSFRTVTAGGNTLGATETLAFTAGSNISISESGGAVTINSSHPSVTEATANLSNSGRTYIQSITLDTNGHVTAVSTGTESVTDTTYSTATSSTLGLVKIGYTENGKNYPVELSNGQMFVNVPWTDTDTDTDTNYYLDGITKSGNTLTFSVNGTSNQSYTFGSNAFNSTSYLPLSGGTLTGDLVTSGSIKTEGPDGGMVMRTWTNGASYGMIGTANMTGNEYVLLTNGSDTYISAATGSSVHIRGGSNDTVPSIDVTPTNIEFNSIPSKTSEATALVWDGVNVGYRELGSNAFNSTSYLPLSGGTLTGTLTINSTNPRIDFNGTSDGGIDMTIYATPEGLDFKEPEDGDKIHFRILDDTGVDAPFGYHVNGTRIVDSSRVLQNVTWQGGVIASAYLDADTAHLSGTQTFTGTKTFNDITSANGYKASIAESSDADNITSNNVKYGYLSNAAVNKPVSGNSQYASVGNITLTHYDTNTNDDFYIRAKAYNGNTSWAKIFTSRNSSGITTVGTITSGEWNGSVISSAYLDADTAHLSGTQTFSGVKTFSARPAFSSGMDVLNSIRRSGDTDTYIDFGTTDLLHFYAGGIKMLSLIESSTDEVVFNDGGVDVDFRVEGSGEANALFVQGSNGNVGIHTNAPDYELHVIGTASFTDTVAGAYFEENASHSSLKKMDTGTILVMNEDGDLIPCNKANDPTVFGASKHGYKQPIVMGAEPIKVTGPIKVGDFITTSDKEGHGMKAETPQFGTIIAQAMESGDGESHTIKAMIRKM